MTIKQHISMSVKILFACAAFWLPMAGYEQFWERVLHTAASPCWTMAVTAVLMAGGSLWYLRNLKRQSRHWIRDCLVDLIVYTAAFALCVWFLLRCAGVLSAQQDGTDMNGLEYYLYALMFLLPPVIVAAGVLVSFTPLVKNRP